MRRLPRQRQHRSGNRRGRLEQENCMSGSVLVGRTGESSSGFSQCHRLLETESCGGERQGSTQRPLYRRRGAGRNAGRTEVVLDHVLTTRLKTYEWSASTVVRPAQRFAELTTN